ncbi:abscisic acid receptor PYL12-like [Papaver somniferum]|uniref:abscisic acid receptor PYL12-like n=1 Tax=Papaver somniferum TaxID=3469 RepID=UPI000E6F4FF9|nr:abscisic acid receptor PYL12-like [Papaver somniferum]
MFYSQYPSNSREQLDHHTSRNTVEMFSRRYHNHEFSSSTQCSSCLSQIIDAPLGLVWSLISRFDQPQNWKRFVRSCRIVKGDGRRPGSVREVRLVSGLPATSSTERLDSIDHENHVMCVSILGGDHRLNNYKSIITLHEINNNNDLHDSSDDDDVFGNKSTVVLQSYVVNIPDGNSAEDTRTFVNTIIKCNLKSLGSISEKMDDAREKEKKSRRSKQTPIIDTRMALPSFKKKPSSVQQGSSGGTVPVTQENVTAPDQVNITTSSPSITSSWAETFACSLPPAPSNNFI